MIALVTADGSLSPAQQLAIDEAALNGADRGDIGPTFRTWAFQQPVVVLGRSSKIDVEVDRAFCDRQGIVVLRRCSGGATIVGGPGCLMYSVVLSIAGNPQLAKIDAAHQFVMTRVSAAVRRQLPSARREGVCDLAIDGMKFSGNALRITRGHVLYHGTILHGGDLDLIAACLGTPPRQPEYRRRRSHRDFITAAPLDPRRLIADLRDQFAVPDGGWAAPDWPTAVVDEVDLLTGRRYGNDGWTLGGCRSVPGDAA